MLIPLLAKVSREVANLTERKHPRLWYQRICLSVVFKIVTIIQNPDLIIQISNGKYKMAELSSLLTHI